MRPRGTVTPTAILLALIGTACRRADDPPAGAVTNSPAEVAAAQPVPALPRGIDWGPWVTIYDPARAASGYTLDLYRRRVPVLFDMNGRLVHAWPAARVKSRARLLADGSLLAIALDHAVVEHAWDGSLAWRVELGDALPHHDLIRLANGNTMVLVRRRREAADEVLEISRAGSIAWRWRAASGLRRFLPGGGGDDATHLNSVQELPPNPWWDRGDERFRPGNLLLSARNLNLVFVLDRASGEVVWSFGEELDLQHEALMIGTPLPGAGDILIFNNRYRGWRAGAGSTVLAVRPPEGAAVWRYSDETFYSPTGGLEQPLANGNLLVTSSRGGRIFEITRTGETVWQWVPPWDPNRPQRYAYDYSPQLAALARPTEEPVRPPAGYRHVDQDLYRLSRRGGRQTMPIDGVSRSVLREDPACGEVLLPAGAMARLSYGIDRKRLLAAGRSGYAARFNLRLGPAGAGGTAAPETTVFEDRVDLSGVPWRSREVQLDAWALQRVRLCAESQELDGAGQAEGRFAYWAEPLIAPRGEAGLADTPVDEEDPLGILTEKELEAQREHLRALGYID